MVVSLIPLCLTRAQRGGVRGMQPYAAMGSGAAEAVDLVTAVDRIAAVGEDRMRHGGVVIFLRKTRSFQPLPPIGADRGAVAGAAGRKHPAVGGHAGDGNG